jgi:ubiquinone biosynthesis protein
MNDRMPPPSEGQAGEFARMGVIARVAVAKGWEHYAERLGFGSRGAAHEDEAPRSDAARLREALEELGPTFVKFGQMLSMRSDVFSDELVSELAKLQDAATTFPAEAARRIIEEETGKPLAELYGSFDDLPMAAASMAQVHCATLPDGTSVIVKVQRPGIAAIVEGDIAVLRRLAGLLDTLVPAMRSLNLPGLVEEFAETLRGEMDFAREGHNAERFAALNRDESAVFVPQVFWQATTMRVLTMEHSPGHRADAETPDPARHAQFAATLMRLFLTQVFEHGVFHADPHPGNVFRLPDGRACFHDFGALGELPPRVAQSLRELFLAVMARDASWAASAYLGMGGATGELDRGAFVSDMETSLDRYYRDSAVGRQSLSAILHEFVKLGSKHRIRLLRATTLLIRGFAELESMVHGLDPEFNSLDAFRAYSTRLLKHVMLPDLGVSHIAELYRVGTAMRDVASGTPVALQRLLGRLERGEPLFDIRHQSGGSLERHMLHASNRLAFALIIASIVIGSSILIGTHAGPHIEGIPLLGIIGFMSATALGIAWAIIALRSGKL